jgi:hypothetical protein
MKSAHAVMVLASMTACAASPPPTVRLQSPVVITTPDPCAVMNDRLERALCLGYAAKADAYRQRDVVKLSCETDKVKQLEVLRDVRRDYTDQPHLDAIAERVVVLQREVESCVGELAAQNRPVSIAPPP